ncbi:MAG: hypothetical protein P1U90_17490, partial [Akkermansiaceae bacterium]|nr:hypothetical protein [Akkermansiaceae bacterium]
ALTPLARMAGRLVSSGTLGFCFIFCFLFSYDGTFTRVFRPMQGSPLFIYHSPDPIFIILSKALHPAPISGISPKKKGATPGQSRPSATSTLALYFSSFITMMKFPSEL